MKTAQSLENQLFSVIKNLQMLRMESKTIFITFSLFKLLFKDTFIILLLHLKIKGLQNIKASLKKYFFDNLEIITISSITIIVALYIFYIYRTFRKHIFQNLADFILPWVDAIGFLILWVSISSFYISQSVIVQLIAIVNVMGVSFLVLCFNLLNCSKFPKVNNLYQFREARTVMLSYTLELIFCIYVSISWVKQTNFSSQELRVYCTLKFLLTVFKFRQKVLEYFYIHAFSQLVSCFCYFIQLNLSLLTLAISFLERDLISANFLQILILMNIFSNITLSIFIKSRNSRFFLSSAKTIKTETDAFIYIDFLKKLIQKIQEEKQDIILIILKIQHQMCCAKMDCFCTKERKNLKLFIENYVKNQLQILSQFFNSSKSVLLSILYFKMILFKFYPQILSKLEEYQQRFNFTLIQRFYSYSLKIYVEEFINRKSVQIRAFDNNKIFNLQKLNEQMKDILSQQIDLRQKKWKYLSSGAFQVEQLKKYCQKQIESIKRVKQIIDENGSEFKACKQFNLLLLFYMTKVSFLGNGAKIAENLRRIYVGYTVNGFHSTKEFNRYIFHKRSCTIQTKIDNNFNNIFIIKSASSNIQDVFGIPKEKAIGKSIQILMPQIIYKQHEEILKNWMKTGIWKTIGKLKEVYCIAKNFSCFSAIFYLKIYSKQTGLYFITSIFKLNENDFILINLNKEIEGMGRRPLKILGQNAKGIPLKLMLNSQLGFISDKIFEQGIVHREIIMSLKEASEQVAQFHNSKLSNIDFKQRQELFYYSLCNLNPPCFIISFVVSQFSVRNAKFTVLKILQLREIQRMKSDCYVSFSHNNISSLKSNDLQNQTQLEKETGYSEDKIEVCNLLDNTSISSLKQRDNIPVSRIKDKFLEIIQCPNQIEDKRMKNQTKRLIFIAVLLSLLNISSYYIYKALLIQIQQIYVADGSVSDIMQLTEIAYDHIFNLKLQLTQNNLIDFDSGLKSAKYLQNYVYGLRQYSFRNLLKEKTSFHSYLSFMYIKDSATWTIIKQQVPINIHQFFQHMYYLTQQLINQLQNIRNSQKTQLDLKRMEQFNHNYLLMLDNNFPEMKRINEYQLVNYQQFSNASFDLLDKISILSMSLHFLITLAGALLINSYCHFRFRQREESFKIFIHIPQPFLQKLKDYFLDLKTLIVIQKKLYKNNRLEDLLQFDTSSLFYQFKSKLSFNLTLRMINYKTYYKWIFILLILIATNGLSYLITDNMRNFFAPSRDAIHYINQLMRKQNRKIETYFDLKASYYLHPNRITQQYINELKIHLNSSLATWNQVATNLTLVLSSYDPNFQNNFKNALIIDVCQLSSSFLPERQNKKCREQLQYDILQKGIMASMNYYQIIVQSALDQMKQFFVQKTKTQQNKTYFRQKEFIELDKMQVYMFKIYQLTQSVCYDSTDYIIKNITNKFLYLNVGFTIFYLVLLVFWALGCQKQKHHLSKLYGLLLLIPINILKSNYRIVNGLKQTVQYEKQ